ETPQLSAPWPAKSRIVKLNCIEPQYLLLLVSPWGIMRLGVRNFTVDLSPVSIRNLLKSHHPYGLMGVCQTYPVERVSTLARIEGCRGKALSRIDHSRSMHFDRVYTMYTKRNLPFSLWISRGRPLDTYVRGQIFYTLRYEFRPRELKVVPDALFFKPALSDEVTIEEFFSAPQPLAHYGVLVKALPVLVD
ncbi:glutamyl-tRNA(Gln) amidotransferase subunit A, partial [Striga asiatica]